MSQQRCPIVHVLATSTTEVTVSSASVYLFVCQQDYTKATKPIFIKFGRKVAKGPRKKPLDFGDNLDYMRGRFCVN